MKGVFLIVGLTTWITVTNQCSTYSFFKVMTSQTCTYKCGALWVFFSAMTQTFKNFFLNVLLDRHLFYHFWQTSSSHGFLRFVQFSVCTAARLCEQWFMLSSNVVYFLLMGQKLTAQGKCRYSRNVLVLIMYSINNMVTYFCCFSVKWREGKNWTEP